MKYPEYILEMLRQRDGLNEDDTSNDDEYLNYSKGVVFNEILSWKGFIGWDKYIKEYVEDIYGVILE